MQSYLLQPLISFQAGQSQAGSQGSLKHTIKITIEHGGQAENKRWVKEYRVIGDLPAGIAERMASLASSIEHAFDFV